MPTGSALNTSRDNNVVKEFAFIKYDKTNVKNIAVDGAQEQI